MATLGRLATRADDFRIIGFPWLAAKIDIARLTAALPLTVIVLVAALLRFWSLESWPVFSDEDSYVTTVHLVAQAGWPDAIMVAAQSTFKAPLLVLIHAVISWLGVDALVAGRALSASAGLVTTVLTWELGRRLGGGTVGLAAAALYALSPMATLHERMINLDPWLTALTLATVLAGYSAIEGRNHRLAFIAAVAGFLAVQAKTPGVAVIALPVVALFLQRGKTERGTIQAIICMLGPLMSYFALMFSPIGPILSAQNAMLMEPFAALGTNLADLADVLWTYIPAGLSLLIVPGAYLAFRATPRFTLVALAMVAVWVAPWVLLGKFAPSRYYLSALPYLCAFVAMAVVGLPALLRSDRSRLVASFVAVILVAASGVTSARLVTDQTSVALTRLDDWQYRSGWPAGYGYADADALVRGLAEPESQVAYMIDMYHVAGAGTYRPLPGGVRSLGLIESVTQLPTAGSRLYVIADDGRDRQFVGADQETLNTIPNLLAQRPDLEVVERFTRPGSNLGVTVLRSR
jgi:4-amino-4-deoxy-L-arabinose transferase-like glycosyltransferase